MLQGGSTSRGILLDQNQINNMRITIEQHRANPQNKNREDRFSWFPWLNKSILLSAWACFEEQIIATTGISTRKLSQWHTAVILRLFCTKYKVFKSNLNKFLEYKSQLSIGDVRNRDISINMGPILEDPDKFQQWGEQQICSLYFSRNDVAHQKSCISYPDLYDVLVMSLLISTITGPGSNTFEQAASHFYNQMGYEEQRRCASNFGLGNFF